MKRLHSDLIGLPLIGPGKCRLGRVFDLLWDPDRGTVLAVATTQLKVIAPVDLGECKEGHWQVLDAEAPIQPDELVRLKAISAKRRRLRGKHVITKDGERLGRVSDYLVDMETLSLLQIYVTKRVWFVVTDKRLISWKDIEEITEEAVVVRANLELDKKRARRAMRQALSFSG